MEKWFDFFLSSKPIGPLKSLTDLNTWSSFYLPPGACKIQIGQSVFKNVSSIFAYVSVSLLRLQCDVLDNELAV